jgi:hypothetical protein
MREVPSPWLLHLRAHRRRAVGTTLLCLRRDHKRRSEQARLVRRHNPSFVGGHDHMLGLDAEDGCSTWYRCWYGSWPRRACVLVWLMSWLSSASIAINVFVLGCRKDLKFLQIRPK